MTPLVLEIQLASGKKYIERIPAEVWRYSPKKITKLIVTDEPMVGLTQDPYWETADIDVDNNAWPRKLTPSRLELFKTERGSNDMMKDFNTPLKKPEAEDRRRRSDAQPETCLVAAALLLLQRGGVVRTASTPASPDISFNARTGNTEVVHTYMAHDVEACWPTCTSASST